MHKKPTTCLRCFRARYALSSGEGGTLLLLANCSCAAVILALELLGDTVCRVSVGPVK